MSAPRRVARKPAARRPTAHKPAARGRRIAARQPVKPHPTRGRAARILDRLEAAHPEAMCALAYVDPFQLLVATILSAQCTDQRVNMVTPALFHRFPTPAALAGAGQAEVEEIIRSTGFFRAKAKSLIGCARALVAEHAGQVPQTIDALVKLPGIGRKTANVVLGHAFEIAEGIAVDTHVERVANRLGLVRSHDPVKIERELMALIPQPRWTRTTDLMISHGRKICDARRPRCGVCPLFSLCAWESRQAYATEARSQ